MKKSKYNFFYEYGDEYIAYNARTNAMALVESYLKKRKKNLSMEAF